MSIIQLRSGRYFDFRQPEDPESSHVDIQDIAWSLSHVCRYTGHCSEFMSVAEHSVHVSLLVPPEHAKAALLHDAHEAYVQDLSSPLKSLLPGYKALEKRVQRAVLARFGITTPLAKEVVDADLRMLKFEAMAVMQPENAESKALDAWSWVLGFGDVHGAIERVGRPPEQARKFFLDRCEELGVR